MEHCDRIAVDHSKNYLLHTVTGVLFSECLKNLLSKGKLLESGDGRECEKEVATLVEKEAAMLDVSSDKVLFDACSMDLGKFCRNIPEGNVISIHGLMRLAFN